MPSMAQPRGQILFTGIGPNEECASPASGVHDRIFTIPDAKRVDDVNNFGPRIILAVLLPLFGSGERLKNLSNDVVFEL